jgi:ATP-binding cassette subfamily C protein
MVEVLRKAFAMLPRSTRLRWLLLLPLMLASAAAEAVGAAGVFFLVRIVNDPARALQLPVFPSVISRLGWTDERSIVIAFTLVLVAFYVAKSFLLLLTEGVRGTCVGHSTATVAQRLLRGYLAAPYEFHFRRNSAELVRNAHESVERVYGLVVSQAASVLTELLVVTAIACVLILASPSMTLTAGGLLFLVSFVFLRATRRAARNLGREFQTRSSEALRHLNQALHAIKEIKVLGREGFFDRAFGAAEQGLARARRRSSILTLLPRLVVETVFICGALLVMILLVSRGGNVGDSLSLLGLCAYAGFRIIPSVNRILWHWNLIRTGMPSVDDVYADFSRFRELSRSDLSEPRAPLPFEHRFELRGVSYAYEDGRRAALRGIDLVIRRGQSLGIVGRTGAGKSTLLDVVVGLLQPTAGELLVDGQPIGDRTRAWQRQIGYVPQNVCLIDASLRDNIALGLPQAAVDENAIRAAIEMAQLTDLVRELPEGIDTVVGERGVRLSGGQRQRIAIARALYHQPQVLVFDEATASLDMETERRVSEAIASLHGAKTLILVAHRLTTVAQCDALVFLDGGRVAGRGTFDELMLNNDDFRAMAAVA